MSNQRIDWVDGRTGTRYLATGIVMLVIAVPFVIVGLATDGMWWWLVGFFLATVGTGTVVRVLAGRSMNRRNPGPQD